VVRMGMPNCGVSEQCIRTFFYPQPGAYQIDTGIKTPAGVPVYIDQNYIIAVTSTFHETYCGGSSSPFSKCATVMWRLLPGVEKAVIYNPGSSGENWWIGTGPYTCNIRTDGFRNTVAFEGKYWQIDCGYYDYTYWPPWRSLGVVKLVFNNDYTVSVYKDGQYLYKVPVYVCKGPLITCGFGPWAPTQKLAIPVFWGPGGIAVGIVPFVHIKNSLGYGSGLTYVYDAQTVAMPFYYRYNLTGAYPYRLEVQIDMAEKQIANNTEWVYIHVTYSGYLKLYFGDKLVAYDALYGWTIGRDQAPPPPEYYEPDRPEATCVPQQVRIPKGMEHRNLQQGQNGYSVEVVKKYVVHEFGCGVDRTYTDTVSAGVYTANGNSYHTRDPNGNVCGFKQARNCGGVVYCNVCPPPSQQSK